MTREFMDDTGVLEKPRTGPFLFLRKFLKYGDRVASFGPSSKALAQATAAHVDPLRPQTILELGAGTGAITSAAYARMHPESKLIAVEIDKDFARCLRARFPWATVLCCDVRDMHRPLMDMGIDRFDLVLSGLPTPSLPRSVNAGMFELIEEFAPGAFFSQLTVMPWVYYGMYKRLFDDVAFRFVPLNFPSGGVYHCRNLRDDYRNYIPGKKRK